MLGTKLFGKLVIKTARFVFTGHSNTKKYHYTISSDEKKLREDFYHKLHKMREKEAKRRKALYKKRKEEAERRRKELFKKRKAVERKRKEEEEENERRLKERQRAYERRCRESRERRERYWQHQREEQLRHYATYGY